METIKLLLDDSRGIYIPYNFATDFDLAAWGLAPKTAHDTTISEIEADLSSPDNENYWDAWHYVLTNAEYKDEHGQLWTLYQDGDLFAVRDDHNFDEE